MKSSMVRLTLLATVSVLVAGCALPYEAEFPHIANMRPACITNNLPPAQMLMHPGPGVEGPGPGVLTPPIVPVAYNAAMAGGGGAMMGPTSQIAFLSPEGMTINWDVSGVGQFDSQALVSPGRYNFPQGAIYRLKVTNIQGRAGVELYPTLEVGPATPRTEAYIAHNAIPFQLTEEDLDQVLSGNFVTKVIYLPDPEYQELALAGVETLVSTRLDPGVDPIVEADRRGSIMAIIRIGNKDLEIPGSFNGGDGNGNGNGYGNGGGCVVHASYNEQQAMFHGKACPAGGACADGAGYGGGMPPGFVAGVTAPTYGMPMCGTPIGLPGPPHVPLGIPAGLQRHTMTNYTHMNIPGPNESMDVCVKQHPGFSYPKPVHHVSIKEHTQWWPWFFHQPCEDKVQCQSGEANCNCSDGVCPQ